MPEEGPLGRFALAPTIQELCSADVARLQPLSPPGPGMGPWDACNSLCVTVTGSPPWNGDHSPKMPIHTMNSSASRLELVNDMSPITLFG